MQRSERTKGRHCTHRAFGSNRRHGRTCGRVHRSFLKRLPGKASRKTRIQKGAGLMQHRIDKDAMLTADVSSPNAHDFLFEAHRDRRSHSGSLSSVLLPMSRNRRCRRSWRIFATARCSRIPCKALVTKGPESGRSHGTARHNAAFRVPSPACTLYLVSQYSASGSVAWWAVFRAVFSVLIHEGPPLTFYWAASISGRAQGRALSRGA